VPLPDHLVLLLQMITVNFEDYPEHRLKFFALLHAITNHCFKCLFAMSPPQLKLLIDSIIWAFRHTERNVAETGLLLLEVRRDEYECVCLACRCAVLC